MFGTCGHYGPKLHSSKEAEASANLFALKKASCMGLSRIALFLDAKEVIDSINGQEDWTINPIILDIKSQCSGFSLVRFFFVPRTMNVVAHVLAKYHTKLGRSFCKVMSLESGFGLGCPPL